jgi:hypothetical protein
MSIESEKNFMAEEFKKDITPERVPDVLEKISAIIENVGRENLETPEVKEKIEEILENLLKEAQKEEKENFDNYQKEITKTVEESRKIFQNETVNFFEEPILKKGIDSEKITQEYFNNLKEQQPKSIIEDYYPVEEMKNKTLLGKAGGIFKKASTLRKWAGILSLSILFHGGLFYGLEKLNEEAKKEKIRSELVLPSKKEISEIQKTIETEEFKEFNQNYLNWDLNELAEICKRIQYIYQQYPEVRSSQKIGYILECEDEEISHIFNQISLDFQEQGIPWFRNKMGLEEMTNEWAKAIQFLDKRIKFEEFEDLKLPRFFCVPDVDYVITGQERETKSYFQITLTIIDSENSAIVGQRVLKVDPKIINQPGSSKALEQKIISEAEKVLVEQKIIKKLPVAPEIEEKSPRIILNQEKYQQFSEDEKNLYQEGLDLIDDLWFDFIIETPEGYSRVSITPKKDALRLGPIKVDGKISTLSFSLPLKYKLILNNQEIGIDNWQDDKAYYTFDNYWFYKGSVGAVSQEKELNFSILDQEGKEIGRFFLEQVPEWFVENIYYQNVQNQLDSIGIYITDADTLKIYQEIGREKAIEAMLKFAEGTVNVERYFNLDLDLQKVRLGSDVEMSNAFYIPSQEKAINLLAPEIKRVQEISPNQEIANLNFILTGQHESLHKMDALLGRTAKNIYRNLSETPIFNKHFEELKKKWSQSNEQEKNKHLFYLIKDGNFYHELNQPEAGHPDENVNEFFVSSLLSAMAEKEKLKTEFQKWPQGVKEEYIETLKIIEEMLREKNVETHNLSATINYLIDLREGKIK